MNFHKTLLSLFALFFTFQATAQSEFQRKNLNDEYSWNNSTREERNEYYFGLKPINLSKKLYHFRFQKSNQIVDLFSENGIEFNGQILNIVQENKDIKTSYGTDSKAYNYLFEPKVIRDSIATRAGQYILNTKAYSIPTDTLIKNWNFNWLDCNGIDFNYKVKANVYNKSYSCPWNQMDSVAHVIELKKLKDTLNEIIDLEKSYSFFKDQLPKGKSYTVNGWINMYIMTNKEYAARKKAKPMRDFQESIKDTIDNYLKTELNRLIPNSKELKCFDDYWLTFSKKGRLTKMQVNMGFWERLGDRDYKKCRRILKKAFRKIRIDFIDPKYTFYRGLTFGQKEIYITDPTIY